MLTSLMVLHYSCLPFSFIPTGVIPFPSLTARYPYDSSWSGYLFAVSLSKRIPEFWVSFP